MEDNKQYANASIGEDEFAVAEKEAEKAAVSATDNGFTYTHKFRKPFLYKNVSYDELTFDFDRLKGSDGLNCERELQSLGLAMLVPTFNGEYQIRIAAKACTSIIDSDALQNMSLYDCNKIKDAVRSFLIASGQ